MASPTEILRDVDIHRFTEILTASPRKIREELFRRLGLKRKKQKAVSLKASAQDGRAKKLYELLQNGGDVSDEVLDELIRNYLYTRRNLLADALDFFEIEHEGGLTDAEIDFISEVEPAKGQALKKQLAAKDHNEADIELYVAYMNIPV